MPATACTRCPAKDFAGAHVARVGDAHAACRPPASSRSPCTPAAPCATTASTERRRERGSRSGPAGSRKPLPKPRPSTTQISTSRAQRVVLQAVVGDDARRTPGCCARSARQAAHAVGRHPHRAAAAAREQDRLVADLGRIGGDASPRAAPSRAAAVAARDDAGLPAVLLQELGDPQHQRRLAAAAGGQVADDDHRNAGARALEPRSAAGRRRRRTQTTTAEQPGWPATAARRRRRGCCQCRTTSRTAS